jgi:hypothetical protein
MSPCPARAASHLTINPLELPLRDLDRALGVLAAGADGREHVEQHEVGERRGCLLADRAEAADRQRPLADVAVDRPLGVGGPHRVRLVGIEGVGEVSLRRLQPLVELSRWPPRRTSHQTPN